MIWDTFKKETSFTIDLIGGSSNRKCRINATFSSFIYWFPKLWFGSFTSFKKGDGVLRVCVCVCVCVCVFIIMNSWIYTYLLCFNPLKVLCLFKKSLASGDLFKMAAEFFDMTLVVFDSFPAFCYSRILQTHFQVITHVLKPQSGTSVILIAIGCFKNCFQAFKRTEWANMFNLASFWKLNTM